MILIDEILISDDVVQEQFHCNLSACKGACCWEGDYGAPLEEEEAVLLEFPEKAILDMLDEESRNYVLEHRGTALFKENKSIGANVMPDGKCVFLVKMADGISYCSIEQAHKEGKIDYHKPISCHLYPIRIEKNEGIGFEAMNYDVWDLCSAACTLGEKLKMPVYVFCRDAIIRKYGPEFYDQLDQAAKQVASK